VTTHAAGRQTVPSPEDSYCLLRFDFGLDPSPCDQPNRPSIVSLNHPSRTLALHVLSSTGHHHKPNASATHARKKKIQRSERDDIMGQSQGRAGRAKPETRHATREGEQQRRRGDIARPGPEATAEEGQQRRPPRVPATMDTFFLSHGSPTLSIDDNIPARHFFKSWVPAKVAGDQPPRAILVVSGHWETATPAVNVIRGSNDTIYDFYGFPKPMYQVRSMPTYHRTPSLSPLPANPLGSLTVLADDPVRQN
jgi:hypothetical protein